MTTFTESSSASFASRRSVVHSIKGIVSSTQPLATQCGLEILRKGGNCADAAVAVAAGLNVTEPGSTGIGGDMFCLFYEAKTQRVHSLNGSGRSSANATLQDTRRALGFTEAQEGRIGNSSVHAITVPGAAAGWVDCVARFGSQKLSMAEILAPAIELAEEGFPVSEISAHNWQRFEKLLLDASPNGAEMLKRDATCDSGWRAPKHGEVMKNPTLAQTFRTLATQGKKGFYAGKVGEEIVKVVQEKGGYLTLDDLQHHMENSGTETTEPIGLEFRLQGKQEIRPDDGSQQVSDNAVMVWEHPPNGQGIVVLMALGILQALEDSGQIERWGHKDHNSATYLHAVIESLRIAFADANWWITDPTKSSVPVKEMISAEYTKDRAKLFSADKACDQLRRGSPAQNCTDTVYFAATDVDGNAISFINSNYGEFGTGIVPKKCGFTLHNRGANFRLQDTHHPNNLAPRKRPYHTIIPGLVTNAGDNSLHSVFGVMGGFMQPQGQVQVLLNQLVFGLTPQEALDAPRVCISAGGAGEEGFEVEEVLVEEGITETTITELVKLGHNVKRVVGMARSVFGRGQVIRRHLDPTERTAIWSAGSDPRGDGAATPQ